VIVGSGISGIPETGPASAGALCLVVNQWNFLSSTEFDKYRDRQTEIVTFRTISACLRESGLQLVAREPPTSAACAAKISNRNSRFIASCNRNRPQAPEHSSLDSRRNLPANRQ
jgi:hypothetical protein